MKTFIPKLLQILKLVCNYINRYKEVLKKHIPEEHWPKLDAVLTACEALHLVLELLIPEEDTV